jgi:hypothetical protein
LTGGFDKEGGFGKLEKRYEGWRGLLSREGHRPAAAVQRLRPVFHGFHFGGTLRISEVLLPALAGKAPRFAGAAV